MDSREHLNSNGFTNTEFHNTIMTAGGNINLTVSGAAACAAPPANQSVGLTDWLSSVNYKLRQIDIFSKVTSGTGHWFLESKEYKMLLEKKAVTVCGTGIPGAGKTYLSSIVINDLKSRIARARKAAVLYVYCRYSELHSVANILGALLRQLAESSAATNKYIQDHFHLVHLRDRTTPSEVDFAHMLKQVVATLKRTFILVDALDELKEDIRHGLLKHLQCVKASILLTSRPSQALERIPEVVMFEIMPPEEDFRLYILQSIRDHPGLSGLLHNQDELKEEVVRVITKKANGMYMLAALQINRIKLEGVLTVKIIKQALKTLPSNLDDMYANTLERIRNQNPEKSALAKRVLLWVLYNQSGPLTIEALREAVTLTPDMDALPIDEKPAEDDVITSCCGLIRLEERRPWDTSAPVHLIHYTTREFLDRRLEQLFDSTSINTHTNLTFTCLKYLNLSGALGCRDKAARDTLCGRWVFLDYAFQSWHKHASLCRGSNGLPLVINDFIRQLPSYPLLDWSRYLPGGNHIEILAPIHVASYFGFVELVEELLHSADQQTELGNTPLHFVCERGYSDDDHYGEEIARLLLDCPIVDINSKNVEGETALHVACSQWNVSPKIIQILLAHEQIDINCPDIRGFPPLAMLSLFGASSGEAGQRAEESLKLLLSEPTIDMDMSRGKLGRSIFHLPVALTYPNMNMIRILLAHGADSKLHIKDSQGKTALDLVIMKSFNRHVSAEGRGNARILADILRAHGARSQSLLLIPSIIGQNIVFDHHDRFVIQRSWRRFRRYVANMITN